MTTTYDSFNSTEGMEQVQTPFAYIENKDTDKIFDWLIAEYEARHNNGKSRMMYYKRNAALYKGIHYRDQGVRDDVRDNYRSSTPRNPKVVVNFISEMVDAKVAQMSQIKKSIAAIPSNDSNHAQINAKGIKLLVDSRYSQINIDSSVYTPSEFIKYLFGNSFTFPTWSKEAGEIHPAYKRLQSIAKQRGIDLNKKKIGGRNLGQPVNVGDVVYDVWGPDRVFPQLGRTRWQDVDDVFLITYEFKEAVKKDYPKLADKIDESDAKDTFMYNYESLNEISLPDNMIQVFHYYHRKMKHLGEGRYIKFTSGCILEDKPLPYDHGKLPMLPRHDILAYGELMARSFVSRIYQLQMHHNGLTSSIARNHNQVGAPKWAYPKGSISINDLSNTLTGLEFKGPIAPKLIQANPTGSETFDYQDKLERYIEKQAKVYSTSRGEPPAGVTASVAMQFLDDQQKEGEAVAIEGRYTYMKELFRMTAQLMAQYYKPEDGRTARILGRDNTYMIKSLKDTDFSVMYDVEIQNTSSLPQHKAARIQTIIDLNNSTNTDQEGPVFKRPEIIQMLDMGNDEFFKDQATVSVKSAQAAVEDIMRGEQYNEPQMYFDLDIHRDIFLRELRSLNYKDDLKNMEEIKKKMETYLMTLEMLMWQRAQTSPAYAGQLSMVKDFPIFFKMPAMPQSMPATPESQGGMVETPQASTMEVNELQESESPVI